MKRRFLSIILSLCMIFAMFTNTTFAISNNLNDLGIKYLVKSEPEETDIRTESLTEVSVTTEASVTTSSNISFRSMNKGSFFKDDPDIDTEYTVIVIDASRSMPDFTNHIHEVANKLVQIKFAYPYSKNIAVVGFARKIVQSTGFTNDSSLLKQYISEVKLPDDSEVMTDLNLGLEQADILLSSMPDGKNIRKNVIILSDGLPNLTKKKIGSKYDDPDSGPGLYQESEIFFTNEAANAAYSTAEDMKKRGYKITSIHFSDNLPNKHRPFATRFMKDLQNFDYYDANFIKSIKITQIAKNNLSGTFRFPSTSENKDFEERFYYDDSYFEKPSQEYNPSLSTMSLCLALSAFASSDEKDYAKKCKNAKELLTKIGFRNFKQNDKYEKKPTIDSIGAVIANKKLITKDGTSYTLIALAIRGGGYESEWAGNFTLGTTEMHAGFLNAKRQVLDFLKKYIKENNITGNIKLWIVGYSRAAATANLLAGSINDGESIGNSKKMHLSHDDMYVYTFETPQGAILNGKTQTEEQKNIHNIINIDDPVPYVAPECWKYTRYGNDHSFPHKSTVGIVKYKYALNNMKIKLETVKSFNGNEYKIDKFYKKKYYFPEGVPIYDGYPVNIAIIDDKDSQYLQGPFLQENINLIISKYIKTKENYIEKFQHGIRDYIREENEISKKDSKEIIRETVKETLYDMFLAFGTLPQNILFKDFDVDEHIQRNMNKHGYYGYDLKKMRKALFNIINLGFNLALEKPLEVKAAVDGKDSIIQGHYPEICLAWLKSEDPKYSTQNTTIIPINNSAKTRKVRINCPVDVEIYENNELIGKIINDKKVLVTSYDAFGLNGDGEKQVYIPPSESYTIKITARDKGTVSYSIVEEHPYKGTAKILNFDNIAIEKGTVLKAYLPKFSKEDLTNDDGLPSSTHYTLFNETKNKEILPTSEYLMDDAKNYRTMIDVETEDIRKGNAVGNGERITNAPVKVFAIPAKGYRLEGWYENGVKVSEEYEYKTKADKYRKLTAKFITFEEYKKKVEQEKKDKNLPSTGGGNSQNKDSDKSKDTKPQKNTDDKSDVNVKKSRYTDIDKHWAQKYITYFEDKDILSAFKDDVFNPNKYITRAELLTMLVKMKNLKTINYKGSFKDVSKDYPYADIIQTAYENKIIKGYGDGTFRADNEISRAEMSAMFTSLAKGEDISDDEIDTLLSIFKDKSKIPQWSKKYMAWSVKNKLIEGYDGNVNAKKNISRAEICTILYKIMTGNMIK